MDRLSFAFVVGLIACLSRGQGIAGEPGVVVGVVAYEADVERPWRYGRYYVKEGRLAEAIVAIEPAPGEPAPNEPAPGEAASDAATSDAGTDDVPADDIATEGAAEREVVGHVMDQKDFRFVPETLAIRAGDRVTFENSDNQVHNVFTGDLSPFNVNTPPGESYTRAFSKAGNAAKPVRIGCIYHSNMRAWIFVFDHAHFEQTAADGAFRLADVPPGRHRLRVVHPAGRLSRTIDVDVRSGATVDLGTITLSPDDLPQRKTSP